MSVKRAVQAVAAVGFVVACYALHVETEMASVSVRLCGLRRATD